MVLKFNLGKTYEAQGISVKVMELTHEYTHDISHRFKHLSWIIAIVLSIICGRLYYLQIVRGSYYYFFSEQNSIKDIKIPALRGAIYDRNGKALVENRPAFDVVMIPQYTHDREKTITSLSEILSVGTDEISAHLQKAKGLPSYYPVIVKEDVGEDVVSAIRAYKIPWYDEGDSFDLRGVDIQMRYARTYPDGLSSSHLLGYLREIDENRMKLGNYKMGDFVGIGGVEEEWDAAIRGNDGFDQRVVNAIGREVMWSGIELTHERPEDGAAITLTIDARLQAAAKRELEGKSGAVVAIDPNNGEILALYSSPSIDLNMLSSPDGGKYWQRIASNPDRPIYNRAIQGQYPPASTYKIVTALAALGEGIIKPDDTIYCGGGLNYGGRFYQCWQDGGHGSISLISALASSCDTFFYHLGLKLGVDKIAKYAGILGLGGITNIDLPGEKGGLIPTSKWKEETKKTPWRAGENLSIAVGQGYNSITPLQNAMMIAMIANGGKKITPHVISVNRPAEEPVQVLNEEDVMIVQKGMQGVVDSDEGTAFRLKSLGLKIAGKTGTAQVIGKETWKSGVKELKDHAWFVGYAPYDNPKIAVAVIVEHGGFGASAAAPVVGKVIEEYLK